MGLLDNGLKGNIVTGLAIGIGAMVFAPAVVPVISAVAKPLAKALIKTGILAYEKGREAFAEVSELVEDITAEARTELAEQAEGAVAPPGPEAGS
jgi:hypothetical protein